MTRLGVLVLALVTAACGTTPSKEALAAELPPAQGLQGALPESSFYRPGEAMEFEFSFHGMVVGRAVLVVGEPGTVRRHRALIVRSELQSAGVAKLLKSVRDDVRTWIDLATGRPLETRSDMLFGDKHLELQSRFHGARVVVDYQRNGKRKPKRRFDVPPSQVVHDAHTALGAMRAWQPQPGERASFYGLSGRRMWSCDLRFAGHETIRTSMGLYPAIRIDGIARRLTLRLNIDKKREPRTFTIWLSDDTHRIPLRVDGHTEYGDVSLEMTHYHRPERYVSRPSE